VDEYGDPAAVVERGYDYLGSRFLEWSLRIDAPLRAEYVDRVLTGLNGSDVVVDLGCGPGVPVGRDLCRRSAYVGVDRSSEMLRLARENVPSAALIRADIADVALRPRSVGGVVAFYSLIHIPRQRHPALLRSIRRWLRPGGRFAASLGAHDLPSKVDPEWLGDVEMFWSFFDKQTNVRLVAESGFEIEQAVESQHMEDGKLVPFLWVLARAV